MPKEAPRVEFMDLDGLEEPAPAKPAPQEPAQGEVRPPAKKAAKKASKPASNRPKPAPKPAVPSQDILELRRLIDAQNAIIQGLTDQVTAIQVPLAPDNHDLLIQVREAIKSVLGYKKFGPYSPKTKNLHESTIGDNLRELLGQITAILNP